MDNQEQPPAVTPGADQFSLDPNLADRLKKKYGPKTRLKPPRKNLYWVTQIVNTFIDMRVEKVTSAELQTAIEELGWREKWNLDPNPIDDNGLRKDLAGLVGGNGLNLAKARSRHANVYVLPKKRISDEYFKAVGIDPDLVRAQAIDQRIVQAIRERRSITFRYREDPETDAAVRKLNPHFYGSQSGAVNVEGYQVAGYTSSGTVPAWRNFRLDDMHNIRLTSSTFTPWPGFSRDNPKYTNPYAMV